MTRIDFYLDVEDKIPFIGRLCAKVLQQKLRMLIYAPEASVASAVNKTLWTQPAISFVPHCQDTDSLAAETPILITQDNAQLPHDEVLLNLHREQPPHFSRFQRLIEIVSCEETDKQDARNRFKFYRDRGYEIHQHPMGERA